MEQEPFLLKVTFDQIPEDVKYKILLSINIVLTTLVLVNSLLFIEFLKVHYAIYTNMYNNISERLNNRRIVLP